MGIVDMQRAKRPEPPGGGGDDIESVTIKRADNGGAIVTCTPKMKSGENGPMFERDQQHAFGSMQEALDYAGQKMGGTPDGGEGEPAVMPKAGGTPDNPSADEDLY